MKHTNQNNMKTKNVDVFSKRLELLDLHGFVQKKGCITNGKYAFLYHQIDTSEMTDEQFTEFIKLVEIENTLN